jgi:hypothetical protein
MNRLLTWLGVTVEEEIPDTEITDLQNAIEAHKKAAARAAEIAGKTQDEACKLTSLATSALNILNRSERKKA